MDLKSNLNKIHSDLISQLPGSEIKITEKESISLGNYIQFSILNEGKEVKLNLRKIDLEGYNFNWHYWSNPLIEESHLVERSSSVETFSRDVKDIFEKNRFDRDYINSLGN